MMTSFLFAAVAELSQSRKDVPARRLSVRVNQAMYLAVAVLPIALCSICPLPLTMQGFFPVSYAMTSDETAEQICLVNVPEIQEASGLACSRNRKDSVWIHNDSGDVPRLFLVGHSGQALAILNVNVPEAVDWEDMASFKLDGESYLLVGDIGDNARRRGNGTPLPRLLLLKEPELQVNAGENGSLEATQPRVLSVDPVAVLEFRFPDGPADCESLAVDTRRKEILLLTKTNPLDCRLYKLPLSLVSGHRTLVAELVATLNVPYATAMDISADGGQLAIVNMFSGALIRRDPMDSWQQACRNVAAVLTLPPRPQGETVCFEPDGESLLLNSEGNNQPLWRVPLSGIVE